METFGAWLAAKRKAFGLTRDELAVRANCAPITIEKIERGERKPSEQVANLIFAALNLPVHHYDPLIRFSRGALSASDLKRELDAQSSSPNHNLPVPITTLVGREDEIRAAANLLLNPTVRLITLTGPGGVGKTRLGLRVAQELSQTFNHGVHFIPLAAISDPERVMPAVAQSLGLKDAGDETALNKLKQTLRDKHALLYIDNFEQVIPAAPYLADLLFWCPYLKALVTSREVLNISGERQLVVPTLQVPDPKDPQPASHTLYTSISAFPSVQLFAERAEAVSDFTLTPENCTAVAQICARLDGLPLAIELAAARTPLLSPAEMLSRLEHPFPLLAGGSRDLPDRHRTLYTAIDWSYNLLTEEEQKLFSRLAVFVGGFPLSSVEAVCNAYGDLPIGALDGVASLHNKSLIKLQSPELPTQPQHQPPLHSGERRFTLLETIREYALEKLDAHGELDTLRQLHAEYYLALAEAAEPELTKTRQAVWFENLDREHDNLRAALSWCGAAPDRAETELRLAGALWWFWQVRGYLGEGRERLETALLRTEAGRTPSRAKAHFGAGTLCLFIGDYSAAHTHFTQSLDIERDLGNTWGATLSLNGLGRVAEYQGDFSSAQSRYEEALDIRRQLNNNWGIAGSLNNLGRVAMRQGDIASAKPLLERGLAIFREFNDTASIAMLLSNLGVAALRERDHETAARLFTESLNLELEVAYKWGIPYCLLGFAEVACARGDSERAACLLGSAETQLNAIGARMDPIDRADFTRTAASARSALQPRTFDSAWNRGLAMDVDTAVSYALQ